MQKDVVVFITSSIMPYPFLCYYVLLMLTFKTGWKTCFKSRRQLKARVTQWAHYVKVLVNLFTL